MLHEGVQKIYFNYGLPFETEKLCCRQSSEYSISSWTFLSQAHQFNNKMSVNWRLETAREVSHKLTRCTNNDACPAQDPGFFSSDPYLMLAWVVFHSSLYVLHENIHKNHIWNLKCCSYVSFYRGSRFSQIKSRNMGSVTFERSWTIIALRTLVFYFWSNI